MQSIKHAGGLVAKTFDESLMSINYARAAAADFSKMRAVASRRLGILDLQARTELDKKITRLESTFYDDLNIAAERSQSPGATDAVTKVRKAVSEWATLYSNGGKVPDVNNRAIYVDRLDGYAKTVDQQIDLLINHTAGDGFLFRQRALSAIDRDLHFNLGAIAIALLLSGFVTWLLSRRIIGQVAVASKAARSIAAGELDVNIPRGGADELGTLIAAMSVMRNNIKDMVGREIAQRRSAQARLTDALENSREGVVLLHPDGKIALANSRSSEFLASAPELLRFDSLDTFKIAFPSTGPALLANDDLTGEACLPDGRWLRVSRSKTQEGGEIVVFSDITALKRQEEQLYETNRRLDAALDNMSQGLCLYDNDGCLQVVNRRFCEIFRIPSGHVRAGMQFESVLKLSIMAGNHAGQTLDELVESSISRSEIGSYFQSLSDGRIIRIDRRSTSDGGWLETCEDVTEQQRAETQIAFMARHDALTHLPNRLLLAERIEQAIAQAGRGAGFSVLCLDLDNFKQVNDTLGHPIGDELLCAVADRLLACVREIDTVARLGGDEFAIIQAGTRDSNDVERLARRIVECIGQSYEFNGQRIVIGCSIGISLAPHDGSNGEKLLKNADLALYRAKAEGSGVWRFFETEMDESLQKRRALELDLRDAMTNGQFELVYQPIYNLKLEKICRFEALLRWRHPQLGLVSPEKFIPVAEEIGLIIRLGEWVIDQACQQAASWPDDIKVSVNVSSVQFRSPRLVEAFSSALMHSRLPAGRLEIEITESVLLTNSTETMATLHKLRSLGLRIAIDDFGTGYSSLSYLQSFPFDKLKIDQSFVHDLTSTEGSKLIVRAIVSLGKSLGMQITAEGVENIAQFDQAAAEGCDEVQGFFLSKPVSAPQVSSVIRKFERRRGTSRSSRKLGKLTTASGFSR
nr:EAL domain-containing protein [Nitrobacter vulgaris]